MSCMSQNFRLLHVSNLSIRNFRFFLLTYPGSVVVLATESDHHSICRRSEDVRWWAHGELSWRPDGRGDDRALEGTRRAILASGRVR